MKHLFILLFSLCSLMANAQHSNTDYKESFYSYFYIRGETKSICNDSEMNTDFWSDIDNSDTSNKVKILSLYRILKDGWVECNIAFAKKIITEDLEELLDKILNED